MTRELSLLEKTSGLVLGHTKLPIKRVQGGSFLGVKRVKLTTNLYLVSRLKMGGGISPNTLHVFIASVIVTLQVTLQN